MNVIKCITIIVLLNYTFVNASRAKVIPPNYNFSLDQLNIFKPGNQITEVEKKLGKGTIINKKEEVIIKKFYIAHMRYKFPVIVQIYKGKILDFFANLPSYFLHNIFHQSLINRFGKQNKYYKNNAHALYVWNDVSGVKYYYTGTCTITCFPIYFSGILKKLPDGLYSYKSTIDSLSGTSINRY